MTQEQAPGAAGDERPDAADRAHAATRSVSYEPALIDVRRGRPTSEELAALIAVVSEAYEIEAAEAVAPEPRGRDAWTLTQRGLREPLRRELGWARSVR